MSWLLLKLTTIQTRQLKMQHVHKQEISELSKSALSVVGGVEVSVRDDKV
jgi:hypothetical protein